MKAQRDVRRAEDGREVLCLIGVRAQPLPAPPVIGHCSAKTCQGSPVVHESSMPVASKYDGIGCYRSRTRRVYE